MATRVNWQDHIVADPDIHHGDPCIKGTRIPVATIIGTLADGMSEREVLAAWPELTREDILAALAFAEEILKDTAFVPTRNR